MARKIRNILLHAAMCVTLLIAPPFGSQKASAFLFSDLVAYAQRLEISIADGVNFGMEYARLGEQVLKAAGQLEQAKALAEQMSKVYKKVGDVITKGKEIYELYQIIDKTRRTIETIAQEYQYYANGGMISTGGIRRMRYILQEVTDDAADILEYVQKTLFSEDSGLSTKEKKEELNALINRLRGREEAVKQQAKQDVQDKAAYNIETIAQAQINEMMGRPIKDINDVSGIRGPRGGSIGGSSSAVGSSGALLPKIDWSNANSAADDSSRDPLGNGLPKDRLFRVVYIIEGLITILMAPIAFYRLNKGEANAHDALLKVVFGFVFAVIMTTIVQAAFFA